MKKLILSIIALILIIGVITADEIVFDNTDYDNIYNIYNVSSISGDQATFNTFIGTQIGNSSIWSKKGNDIIPTNSSNNLNMTGNNITNAQFVNEFDWTNKTDSGNTRTWVWIS